MTQDEMIELALKVDLMGHELAYSDWYKNRLEAFAKLIAEKEREACAKIADEWAVAYPHPSRTIVEWIRKRGQA